MPELRGRAGVTGQWVCLSSPALGAGKGALCLLKCCLGSSPRWAVSQGSYCALPFFAVEEIEQMNSLFQQKQRELVLAVSKVEELTRQLEMLKNGRIDGYHDNQSAVAELDRLYKELQVMGGQPVTFTSSGLKVGWVVSYLVGKKSCWPCSCQGCVTACVLRMEG